MIRPGRRQALAGFLAAAATLSSGRTMTTAKKKGRRKKCSTCPTCAEPTVCPPAPDTCPFITCCQCIAPSPTPGCHLGPGATSGSAATALCRQLCGGGAAAVADVRGVPDPGLSFGCTQEGTCATLRCPLI